MENWPQFDSSCLLGIDAIDRQHRRLFEIAGRVYDNLSGDAGAHAAAAAAAAELLDYTATHFADEEALMAGAGYPALEAHRQEHADLISKVRDMEMRAEFGDRNLPAEMSRFLLTWLVTHIRASDHEFGEFLAARR